MNRNKKSCTLNLRADAGKEIFMKLAAGADVVIEGFRPGVVARLGIDYGAVRKVNARGHLLLHFELWAGRAVS